MPPAQCRTADTPSVRQRFQSSCCDHVDSFYVACSGEAVPSVIMRPKNSLTTVAAILNRGRQLQQQQRKLLGSGGAYRHRGSHGTNTLVCSTVATYCEHSCDLQIVPFAGSTRNSWCCRRYSDGDIPVEARLPVCCRRRVGSNDLSHGRQGLGFRVWLAFELVDL